MLREPAVAGRFYPSDPKILRHDVNSYLQPKQVPVPAIGCLAPHAGYMYSGQVAGAVFSKVDIPSRCVVLGPNHTGRGHPLALTTEGEWRTPLGNVELDAALAKQLMEAFPALVDDSRAHQSEHAIEVELPFLQLLRPQVKFVPIAIGTGHWLLLEQLGEALGKVIEAQEDAVLIIVSSDLNHYEDDATTRVKDRKAIDRILQLDASGLYHTVMNESISMCGFGPAVVMLTAARTLGAQSAELIQYATSGDVSGDRETVVGYAAMLVK